MKKTCTVILISFLLTTPIFAQDFRVPAGQIKLKEDYTEYEKDIVAADKWIVNTPFDEQPERRKQVYQFIFDWVNGSPTVYCEITPAVLDFQKKNFGMLFIYMGGVARYVLEHNYSNDTIPKQKAALQDMITVYKSGKGIKKDKKMEKLIKAVDEGELEEWMRENMKLGK